jgi:hypothetical protein
MYRDIGLGKRELRFSGAGNGRMVDFAGGKILVKLADETVSLGSRAGGRAAVI